MYLVSTTQRCGSTLLTRLLSATMNSKALYIDCHSLGFRLANESASTAISQFEDQIEKRREVGIFKTHDIASKDFDPLCHSIPNLRILTVSRDFKDVVVSRYFYYRYYWHTDPGLGPQAPDVRQICEQVEGMEDREALSTLLDSKILRTWANEWLAFETQFTHPNVARIRYANLVDGSDFPVLEQFCGRPVRRPAPFAAVQRSETEATGRAGNSRFNREGRVGQWKEWFSSEQAIRLDRLAGLVTECEQGSNLR